MRREEKIELILKHLGKNGWKITSEQRDRLYNSKGKIKSNLSRYYRYIIGNKIICKDKDYIFIDGDDSIEYDRDCWTSTITLYANGCGDLILPILYHTMTGKKKIVFGCKTYYVDLTHINTEEEITDIIAQCEEKIANVRFKIKEYESKIREQKMKKDF